MCAETLHPLPADMLAQFAAKGVEGGPEIRQTGDANGVKVRRIMQLVLDLTGASPERITLLDLACGEGVYAIEAGLRGAQVRAIDARTERMHRGAAMADRLGLENVRFEQNDVRGVTAASHGEFDVVLFLGILYHLDVPDVFRVLAQLRDLTRQWLVIDTHVALAPRDRASHEGRVYRGTRVREHDDDDAEEVRRARLLASLDNAYAFYFDKASLVRLLVDTGFTTVVECCAPLEPGKPGNRVTLAARRGEPAIVSTYPWVNGQSEDDIERQLRAGGHVSDAASGGVTGVVKRALRRAGFELRRLPGGP